MRSSTCSFCCQTMRYNRTVIGQVVVHKQVVQVYLACFER
jgi:hypothetical protein